MVLDFMITSSRDVIESFFISSIESWHFKYGQLKIRNIKILFLMLFIIGLNKFKTNIK